MQCKIILINELLYKTSLRAHSYGLRAGCRVCAWIKLANHLKYDVILIAEVVSELCVCE